MPAQIYYVIVLTFVIHLMSTLAYAVRLVGVGTGRLLISFSLFNILMLSARVSHAFQVPFLTKTVESNINAGILTGVTLDFRLVLAAASAGTLIGAALIPTFIRIFTAAVNYFNRNRSTVDLILQVFTWRGLREVERSVRKPSPKVIRQYRSVADLPHRILLMNVLTVGLITVGVVAAIYAGYINPELRATASSLTMVITGSATILMLLFIDPYLAALTEDVADGKQGIEYFRRCIFYLVAGRFAGTLLAQLLLIPGAHAVAAFAEIL